MKIKKTRLTWYVTCGLIGFWSANFITKEINIFDGIITFIGLVVIAIDYLLDRNE